MLLISALQAQKKFILAAFHLDVDGVIEITASHNPMGYNGSKFVGREVKPISCNSGLRAIQQLAEENEFSLPNQRGTLTQQSILPPYIEHLLGYINLKTIKPLRLVVNAGNGAAGHVIDAIEQKFKQTNVSIEFIKIHHNPDVDFPNGISNPLSSMEAEHIAA